MPNSELNLLNHILKTKDIVTPLAANSEDSFTAYREEWLFVKDYYLKHREVPPFQVFENAFPLVELYNTDGAIEFYIEQLHKDKARSELTQLLSESAINLRDGGPYSVIRKLSRAVSKLGRDTRMIKDVDLVANANERLESFREGAEIRKSGRKIRGIPSGISRMDNAVGGWQPGDFIVIAGWSGSYKSWLALYMAINAWKEGYRVLYFSLEMGAVQLGYRFDTLLGGFNNSSLIHAMDDITYDQYKGWADTTFRDRDGFIVVTNEELDEINQNTVLAKIEQWAPNLVIIDYHNLMDDISGTFNETEKIRNLSKAFKRIAMKTKMPIIDITQVTQDKKDIGNKPPELHDLAWSKQLAYDSDITLALYKPEEGHLEAVSRKVRSGRDFHFWLEFDFENGSVKELLPSIMKENNGLDS